MREGLTPIIFVLNNRGYTIERYLVGWKRKYNDVANWQYTQLLSTFGDVDGTLSKSYKVDTKDELTALLNDKSFTDAKKIQLVELKMDKFDAPKSMIVSSPIVVKENKYTPDGTVPYAH
jgi:pyruvate decarboxylase